jgi:hypothetical protein
MLSVLIPSYNYFVFPLVIEINKQLCGFKNQYEILVYDDGSNSSLNKKNEQINTLEFCSFKPLKTNIGRTEIRNLLAKNAKFDNLLFLDADVLPKNKTFIQDYLIHIKSGYEIIFGGFAYSNTQPKKDNLLRWKYGKICEEIDASNRNKKPYKVIISANMLVKKDIFTSLNSEIFTNLYGLDNYFGALLKQKKINVLHINNEVFHLGIDTSAVYLKKKEQASNTLLYLYKEGKLKEHSNDLFSCFLFFKRYKLNHLFSLFFSITKKLIRRNLLGKNPSITLLHIYRFSYMCHADLKYKNE